MVKKRCFLSVWPLSIFPLVFFMLLTACSASGPSLENIEKSAGSEGMVSVGITLRVPSGSNRLHQSKLSALTLDDLRSLKITVTDANGLVLTASDDIFVSPGQLIEVFLSVPAGPARQFSVELFDRDGRVVLFGMTERDLGGLASISIPIVVSPPLSIVPEIMTVSTGHSVQINVILSDAFKRSFADPTLRWEVEGIIGGNTAFGLIKITNSLSASYTAPENIPVQAQVLVKAHSVSRPAYFASVMMDIILSPQGRFVDNGSGSDETGPDGTVCGGETSPCKTVTKGIEVANPGDTVFIKAGRYAFTTFGPPAIEMKAGVKIQGAGAEVTFFDFTSARSDGGIGIRGANGSAISGLTLSDVGLNQIDLIETDHTDFRISGNIFLWQCETCLHIKNAVHIQGGSGISVTGNVFSQRSLGSIVPNSTSILIEGSATPAIVNNAIWRNHIGILIRGQANALIEGNEILGNERGIQVEAFAVPDIGGGGLGSLGGNILSCNTSVDLLNNTPGMLFAQSNQWDHESPERGSLIGNGIDIVMGHGEGNVDASGASFYSFAPCQVGITVSSNSGLATSEVGGIDTFTVVLNTEPTENVILDLASSDVTEGIVTPSILTFTPVDWDIPKLVTVAGLDDALEDGDVLYRILIAPTESVDPLYHGIDLADPLVMNQDNDVSLSVSVQGSGSVAMNPPGVLCFLDCTEIFTEGTSVLLTAASDSQFEFVGWDGDCVGNALSVTVDMADVRHCSATFRLKTFTLSVIPTGSGDGMVRLNPDSIHCPPDCSVVFPIDTQISLLASPQTGSFFAGWTGHPDCDDALVSMTQDMTCEARFETNAPPRITRFTSGRSLVPLGETTRLFWTVEGFASSLQLNPGGVEVRDLTTTNVIPFPVGKASSNARSYFKLFATNPVLMEEAAELTWAKGMEGSGFNEGLGIVVLSDGSSIVTGRFEGVATFGSGEESETVLRSFGGSDIYVARYHADGSLIWVRQAGGAQDDWSNAIAILPDESVVLTGRFDLEATFARGATNETVLVSEGREDVFIARYSREGVLVWVKQAGGGSREEGFGVASFPDGSFVITGFFSSTIHLGAGEENETSLRSEGRSEIFIARYNANGTLSWAKRAGGTGSESGLALATFSDGSAVVTGRFSQTIVFGDAEPDETELSSIGNDDIFIARYHADGMFDWARQAGGSGKDRGHGIASLPNGSVVVIGRFEERATFAPGEQNQTSLLSSGLDDFFLARYQLNGSLDWVKQGGGVGSDVGNAVAAFPDGSVVTTGHFTDAATFGSLERQEAVLTSNGEEDVFVATYHSDGTLNWVMQTGGSGFDSGKGVASASDGSAVMTGKTVAGSFDTFITRYTPINYRFIEFFLQPDG
ncbi:MAG: DUF1565 domain-containing protein [Nitrospiria bacterium]